MEIIPLKADNLWNQPQELRVQGTDVKDRRLTIYMQLHVRIAFISIFMKCDTLFSMLSPLQSAEKCKQIAYKYDMCASCENIYEICLCNGVSCEQSCTIARTCFAFHFSRVNCIMLLFVKEFTFENTSNAW